MKPGRAHRIPDPKPAVMDAEQTEAFRYLAEAGTGSATFRDALLKAHAPTLLRAYRDFFGRFPMNHGRVRRLVEELARRAEAAERAGSVPVADLVPATGKGGTRA